MDKKTLIIVLGVIVVIVIALVAIFAMKSKSSTPSSTGNAPAAAPAGGQAPVIPIPGENVAPSAGQSGALPSVLPGENVTSMTDVSIGGFAFQPANISIKKGTAITWTNNDGVGHDVVANGSPSGLRSPVMKQGEKYTFIFDTVGTFDYHCGIHPSMKGTVVVTE